MTIRKTLCLVFAAGLATAGMAGGTAAPAVSLSTGVTPKVAAAFKDRAKVFVGSGNLYCGMIGSAYRCVYYRHDGEQPIDFQRLLRGEAIDVLGRDAADQISVREVIQLRKLSACRYELAYMGTNFTVGHAKVLPVSVCRPRWSSTISMTP